MLLLVALETLLEKESVIIHEGFPIKMKRKARRRDAKTISVKIQSPKKIDFGRVKLYIETLVGQGDPAIHDVTSEASDEQTYLVQCRQAIGRRENLHKAEQR